MKKEMIKELIGKMTLEEKAGMCSGADILQEKLRQIILPEFKANMLEPVLNIFLQIIRKQEECHVMSLQMTEHFVKFI